MAKVKKESFSQRRPALGFDVLGDVDAAVLTLKAVDAEVKFEDRTRMVLTFEEFPDHAYWPNVTSIGELIAYFGEETDEWIGKKVALHRVKTNNPQTKKAQDSLWVVGAEEMDDVIAEFEKPRRAYKKRGKK